MQSKWNFFLLSALDFFSSLDFVPGGQAIQYTVDVGNYAPAARTTLNRLCVIMFLSEIELVAS